MLKMRKRLNSMFSVFVKKDIIPYARKFEPIKEVYLEKKMYSIELKKIGFFHKIWNWFFKKNKIILNSYFNKYSVFIPYFRKRRYWASRGRTIYFFKKSISTFKYLKLMLSRIFFKWKIKTKRTNRIWATSLNKVQLTTKTESLRLKRLHKYPDPKIVFGSVLLTFYLSYKTIFNINFKKVVKTRRRMKLGGIGLRTLLFSNANYGKNPRKFMVFDEKPFKFKTYKKLVNLFFILDRFLFFSGSVTFKWVNGLATLLIILAAIMAVSGELICLWYTTHIVEVKASLLFLKYNTMFGDLLVRTHKILIATAFATVFFHMGKAIHFSVMFGSRNSTWKTGFLILVIMFLVSYAGCILPWTVLSPTLYTMVQTIVDTYVGGWAVFVLLGGEKYPMTILARTLVVHILAGLLGVMGVILHIRAVHFVCSSGNRFYTWVTADRPLWLPNEIVKELYLLYFFFFFFLLMLYKKSISWGSFYVSLHKFYYGGATNWNNLPSSIEPEWYFWIFYFALASASSLSGGLIRVAILFVSIGIFSTNKVIQCNKTVETVEEVSLNNFLLFSYIVLFLIFFNRARGSFWHIYFLDLILFFTLLGESILVMQNPDFIKKKKVWIKTLISRFRKIIFIFVQPTIILFSKN